MQLHLRGFPAELRDWLKEIGAGLSRDSADRRGPVSIAMECALRAELDRRTPESPPDVWRKLYRKRAYLAVSVPAVLVDAIRARLYEGESLTSFSEQAAERFREP